MKRARIRAMLRLSPASLGMPAVLVALCAFFAWATWSEEPPSGGEGGTTAAQLVLAQAGQPSEVVVVTGADPDASEFVAGVRAGLTGRVNVVRLDGPPSEVRAWLQHRAREGRVPSVLVVTPDAASWSLWRVINEGIPELRNLKLVAPQPQGRSAFLSPSNLRNVADQIAVIAIIAVGMTMVIITGGIDLSVGSLVALSAVATAWAIQRMGGASAGGGAVLLAGIVGITLCGVIGAFSGAVITRFRIPPFIATLAMMQVASGLAFILARGQTIYDVPPWFTALGRGTTVASLPNAVVLMLAVYTIAHVVMTRTALGRRIYAVGGNAEASRLSGVNNALVLLVVYVISGLTAGLGGVITASQLKAGSPTYGLMYELYVIAAVVVGGTSLAGGQGHVLGTLVGAFIIAVIRNGMNLMNVEPYTQKVVLGLVILGAVLVDRLRRGSG